MKEIKTLALLVLFTCLVAAVKAQYIVTKVSGKVKTESGNYVRPGTQLKKEDKLTWSTPKDKLWVIIVGKGEKIITPSAAATPGKNLLSEVLSYSLHQDSRSGSLSGRGEIIERVPDALRADANSNHKIIIEQENKFLFDAARYPQADGNTFFIEIDVPAQRPIIRVLKTVRDTLMLNYPDFVTETDDPGIKYSIGYHSKSSPEKSQLVVTFKPYFDLTNEMEEMVANSIIAYQNSGNNKDAVRDSIYRNVYASSGKPNGILFTDLFNRYWQNKGLVNENRQNGGTGGIFDEQEFMKTPKLSSSLDVTRAELPANYSLRQYAPPVGYQGQFGSCTAWSTAYAARTMIFAIQHNYSLNNQYDKILNFTFAPDFIYNNIKRTPDCNAGTAIPIALNFMKVNGNIIKSGDFACGKTYNTNDLSNAQTYKIKDFIRINDPKMSEEELTQKMKSLIVSRHPLPFGMHTVESFDHVGISGIWYPTEADRVSAERVKKHLEAFEGHAMCVIGYNDAINNGSFEIMNSWGTWNGNKGFYWISYDDFYAFVSDVYSVNDFELVAPEIKPVIAEVPVPIKLVVTSPRPDVTPIVRVESKPKLKGDLEFMLLKPDDTFEIVPVDKKQLSTRGQLVEGDSNDSLTYANFLLSKPFYSGNKYKIKFGLAQPAYVYVIGMDKLNNYTLFPQKALNESALIDINNATLFLPNDNSHYTLDNVTGKERMCILVSKSPIDLEQLNEQFANDNHNLYQAVRHSLAKRLLEMKSVAYSTDKISFDTEVGDSSVLAFFIEMNHL